MSIVKPICKENGIFKITPLPVAVFMINRMLVISGSWIDLKADSICEALIKCNDPVNTVSGTWSRNGNQMTLDCPIFASFSWGIDKDGTITNITENELTFETHTTGRIVPLKVEIFLTKTP